MAAEVEFLPVTSQLQGFGLVSDQDRNRWELAARMQNIWGKHTFKYGFEFMENRYAILTTSSGPGRTFGDPHRRRRSGERWSAGTIPGHKYAGWCSHHKSLGRLRSERCGGHMPVSHFYKSLK